MPATLGLSLIAGVEETYEFDVKRYNGGDVGVEYYQFRVIVRDKSGVINELGATAQGSVVTVGFPALPEGEYSWALVASDASGAEDVLVSGKLGVFWPNLRPSEGVVHTPNRRVVIRWQDGNAVARWQRTDFASMATKAAQEAAESAEKALENVRKDMKVVQGFLAIFDGKVEGVAAIDPETGNLIIGGKDLGVSVAGKSPYVDENGHWQYWSDELGEWLDGGRVGGIDGDKIRRILVGSYEEIPQEGDTCNGGVYYYVPNGEFYDIYAWFEKEGWVRVDMKYDLADTDTYGLMKYGVGAVVHNGALVGRNAEGQASLPLASETIAGAVKTAGSRQIWGTPVYTDPDNRLFVPSLGTDFRGEFHTQGCLSFSIPGLESIRVATDVFYFDSQTEGTPGITIATTERYGVVMQAKGAVGDGYVSGDLLARTLEEYAAKDDTISRDDVYTKEETYSKEEADGRFVVTGGNFHVGIEVINPEDYANITRDPAVIYFVRRQTNA